MKSEKENNNDVKPIFKFGIPSLVLILCAIPFFITNPVLEFEELYNVIEVLFSGLAFAGIIIAIFYQSLDLKNQNLQLSYQRKELHDSKEELEKQRNQLEIQSQALKKQNFESSFFRILELHNSILQDIEFSNRKGRQAITQFNRYICTNFDEKFLEEFTNRTAYYKEKSGVKYIPNTNKKEIHFKTSKKILTNLYEAKLNTIGHYLRNLFHLVRFVDESTASMEVTNYIKIVRAQLSSDELCILTYNCLTERGENFKPLVERAHLLKNMDKSKLCSEKFLQHFDPDAFG